ncbi:MAG: hypothetical protein ACQUYJ_05290 [Ferruginibacter sp.]
MKKYFALIAFLFITLLVTAQPNELFSLKDHNLKGKVKSVKELSYFAKKNGKPDGEPYMTSTYSFNEKGLLQLKEQKDNQSNISSKRYEYNENKQVGLMSFDGYGSHVLKYAYEQKGKTLWQYAYWQSGAAAKKGDLQHKFMFTLDNAGRLVEYAKYYFTKTNFDFKDLYTYNISNQVEEMKKYQTDGKLGQRFTYSYDKNNNVVEQKEYSYNYKDNELKTATKLNYEYDSNNNWTEMFQKENYGTAMGYKKTVRTIEYY